MKGAQPPAFIAAFHISLQAITEKSSDPLLSGKDERNKKSLEVKIFLAVFVDENCQAIHASIKTKLLSFLQNTH